MKGILKVFEAVITILTVFVVYILLFSTSAQPPDLSSLNLQLQAFNALQALDATNDLRTSAIANDTVSITSALVGNITGVSTALLPSNVNFLVNVCSTVCSPPVINSTRIVSVDYIIAGDINNYNPRQIVVYMWS